MRYAALTVSFGLALVAFAGPALALECPALIKQIDTETAMRFDPAAAEAKAKAAEAVELNAKGKQADCEKVAKEGLKALGIQQQ
jgi:hypothetical protein